MWKSRVTISWCGGRHRDPSRASLSHLCGLQWCERGQHCSLQVYGMELHWLCPCSLFGAAELRSLWSCCKSAVSPPCVQLGLAVLIDWSHLGTIGFFCCLPIRKQKQKTDKPLFIDLKSVRRCRQHKESRMTQFNTASLSSRYNFYNPCTFASSFCFPFLYYSHIQSCLLQEMRMDQ